MLRTDLKIALLVAAMSGLAGCATTSDTDALRDEVRQANQTAQEAVATAEAARKQAAQASQDAAEARAMAEAAKASADESNEKIDRMFKKSMYK